MSERRHTSVTALAQWRRCRRQYKYERVEGLQPKDRAMPLRAGILFHECLEKFYCDKQVVFDAFIASEIDKQVLQIQADPSSFRTTEEELREMGELVLGMVRGYVEKYADDHRRFEVLAVEREFRFALRVPCSSCEASGDNGGAPCAFCSGTGMGRKSPVWDCLGYIDLILEDKDLGVSLVCESKTSADADLDTFAHKMVLSPQPIPYVYAAREIAGLEGWAPISGLFYNVARKKLPAVPQTTQCKSCKGEGQRRAEPRSRTDLSMARCQECAGTGVGGISKAKNTDTTVALFEAALSKQPHLPRADYQDLIDTLGKRGDRFFWRRHAYVSDDAVTDWQVHSMAVAKEIGACERGAGTIHRNEGACFSFGRRCPFWRLCIEDDPMARNNFTVRENELPEMDTPQGDEA